MSESTIDRLINSVIRHFEERSHYRTRVYSYALIYTFYSKKIILKSRAAAKEGESEDE